jgi:hypothetical protein
MYKTLIYPQVPVSEVPEETQCPDELLVFYVER